MKKYLKIIIIGCGSMGEAHLKSVLTIKKSARITILEKNNRLNYLKKKYENNRVTFLNKLPSNSNFDYAIIATNSEERFKIVKNFLHKNSVKYLLLEKFVFLKKEQYSKAKIFFKKKSTKVFVNIWANLFTKICNLKRIKNLNYLEIRIRKGRILTNLVHYLSLIEILINKSAEISFDKGKFIKKKFGNKNFTEFSGDAHIMINNKIIGKVTENKSSKFDNLNFKSKKFNENIKILDKHIVINSNKKKHNKKFDFPLNSKTTKKILLNISSNRKKIVPNFNTAAKTSIKILNKIKLNNLRIR